MKQGGDGLASVSVFTPQKVLHHCLGRAVLHVQVRAAGNLGEKLPILIHCVSERLCRGASITILDSLYFPTCWNLPFVLSTDTSRSFLLL